MNLIQGDCLDKMQDIESGSVDLVLTDPPYGTTACKWDSIIDLDLMWIQLKRVIKSNGAIVMTSIQPFTTTLISSNMNMFRYCWVWEKSTAANFVQANVKPLTKHEDVCVFYKSKPTYNPIKVYGEPYIRGGGIKKQSEVTNDKMVRNPIDNKGDRFPSTVIRFSNGHSHENDKLHPTQKPVSLMAYLINTYTNKGDTVLDFTMGSGTTGVACVDTGRDFIGIELDKDYYNIACKRIKDAEKQLRLF